MTIRPYRIGAREIDELDIPAVVALLTKGFPVRGSKFWSHALGVMSQRSVPTGFPRFGYLLECNGAPVGVILQIFSITDTGTAADGALQSFELVCATGVRLLRGSIDLAGAENKERYLFQYFCGAAHMGYRRGARLFALFKRNIYRSPGFVFPIAGPGFQAGSRHGLSGCQI
jgi:hypothetical protein